jgi:hypothetical protein
VHPPSAYRDAEMRAGRVLFRLWGVPWTVTSRSWQFLASRMCLGLVVAVLFLPNEDWGVRALFGVLDALVVLGTNGAHVLGHTLGGLYTGSPMSENLITPFSIFTVYRDEAPNLPQHIHLSRALGGPLANLALGLVTLGLWLELGGHLPLFAAVLNFLLGAGLLLPLPGADGEVIWRAIQRR